MEQKKFTEFIKTDLNKEQQKAVSHTSGSQLVIAGAGSGKTRVITARITNLLLNEDVHPAQIVALTFTNKAAKEMKERIKTFLGTNVGMPFVGTFHSYCLYLLKTNSHLLQFDAFTIMDEDDKRLLLGKLLKKSDLYKKQTAQQLSYTISLLKNQIADPKHNITSSVENQSVQAIIHAYEIEKRNSKCFDFDDLLIETVRLFGNQQFKDDHQQQVDHILVDEYQDTNAIQHSLLKHMALTKKGALAAESICVVGDEDQSIYSWRGATVDNIIGFKKDFKKTQTIKIEQNYRSKSPILQVANAVIKNNKKRNEKKLWSTKDGRDCVRLLRCLSSYQESEVIAKFAKSLHEHNRLKSTAVLYRTHFQSRTIEEALIKQGVPYHIIGGIRFYERKEIKDLISYLRLMVNPFDHVAFSRAINCPARGLGDKFQEAFMNCWQEFPEENFKDIAKRIAADGLAPSKKEMLAKFVKLFDNQNAQSQAATALSHIIVETEYVLHIKKSYEKTESEERIANIKEFVNAAHFFAQQGKQTVESLLDEISLLQEQSAYDKDQPQGITLMTLHAAKGLEFDTVIIPGLEENIFPSSRSINDREKLEEERRLFYVGITRARNRLLITHSTYRQMYGQMDQAAPSRFLDEIPSTLCKDEDIRAWKQYDIEQYFSQWTGLRKENPELFTFSQFIPKHAKPSVSKPTQFKSATARSTLEQKNTTKRPRPAGNSPQKTVPKKIEPSHGFKKHQTIKHKTFGIGVIKSVEEKRGKVFINAQFKEGLKKIDSKFLDTL